MIVGPVVGVGDAYAANGGRRVTDVGGDACEAWGNKHQGAIEQKERRT